MTTATIPLEQHLKEMTSLNEKVSYLEEQLEWFKRQLFGQKADKFVDKLLANQLCFEGFDKLTEVPY